MYVGLTLLCGLLDFIEFFTQVKHFGEQSAFADLALVAISAIFLIGDFYYHLWVMTLSYKLPDYVGTSLAKAFFGLIEEIHMRLGGFIARNRNTFSSREIAEKQRFDYVSGTALSNAAPPR
jgi:hypothetical protein